MNESRPLDLPNDNPLKELQLRDYLDILSRRKLWIILTSMGLFILTVVVAFRLPDVYHSETVILVDPQQVPNSYVPSTVTETVTDRLSAIRQLVLSPTRISELIQRLRLFPELSGKRNEQTLIALVQKSISIEVADAGGQRVSAFKIGYSSRNPMEAAQVANQLAATVIEESLKVREHKFSGTEEFLTSELEQTKKQLEEKETEVGQVKRQYIMDLPDSKQFHLQVLENLHNQMRNSQDRVNRAEQEKVYLQSVLVNSNPGVDMDASTDQRGPSRGSSEIQKLESTLSELQARYGPDYPDVRKARSQLDALKSRKAQEDADGPVREVVPRPARRTAKNPVVESQIAKLDQEIADQMKLQPQLQEQINFHESKLGQVPIFEGRIVGLMRDYDTLRGHYNSLLERKLSAEMASALENHQRDEHFEILDPAPIPDRPSGPKRLLISLAGLVGGLLGGFGLAMMIELTDESVRSEKEASRIFGTTVFASIPYILSQRQRFLNRLRIVGAVCGTVVCSVVVGFLISYVSQWIA